MKTFLVANNRVETFLVPSTLGHDGQTSLDIQQYSDNTVHVREHKRTKRTEGEIIHIAGMIAKYLKSRRSEQGWASVELISKKLQEFGVDMSVKQVSGFMDTAISKNKHIGRLPFKNAYIYEY